ncbi:glycoside hydrolase family 15 protein [Consotaella salsifontis]|uniref:Trehalase n=1 Tax=Consotaella salsifontis TaxID=1365950 RepID=A0A1T4SN47_9HYPH|nr:glycoside hydrolase family 15 protein [Consotaella salsifontis]SKA29593.1 Glucoamylase (glucan-1,4-alpha-glucosidase), GH15 family [Consotaella salsifontis]
MTSRIEDYALIGDCETAALVCRDGSIDWLCLPRFDSSAVFAALLGDEENGRWRINPSEEYEVSRRYRPGTLVLETEYRTKTGRATIIDFMPPRDGVSDIMRIVVGEEGTVEFDFDLVMRFDYGRSVPWVDRIDDHTLTAVAGPNLLVLHTPVDLHGEDMHTKGCFTVSAGERLGFSLTHNASHLPPPAPRDAEACLKDTEAFWIEFSSRCPEIDGFTEDVRRSIITLKALTFRPTGGIVAAPTTSLPEEIGGKRNWDYRYCWLRDATLTLMAFMDLGYYEEAEAWREWLMRSVAGNPAQMQIMYGVAGERELVEWEIPWLKGFRESAPVRVGNAAAGQHQLDIFGEVADMLMQARKGGLAAHPRTGALGRTVIPYLEQIWRQPDSGIWEVRGGPRHFVHSKVMAWVAFDRAARMAEDMNDDGNYTELVERWRAEADAVHAEVCEQGFDAGLGSFVQSYGAKVVDASLLFIPLTGFLPIDDERVEGTIALIEKKLLKDGFVLRYDTDETDDGVEGSEGAFLACSLWLADIYIMQERFDEARTLFERVRAVQNDVGLLAEEYDPKEGVMLGNFPQAFSHLALIVTALNLSRAVGPAQKRADGKEEESETPLSEMPR